MFKYNAFWNGMWHSAKDHALTRIYFVILLTGHKFVLSFIREHIKHMEYWNEITEVWLQSIVISRYGGSIRQSNYKVCLLKNYTTYIKCSGTNRQKFYGQWDNF